MAKKFAIAEISQHTEWVFLCVGLPSDPIIEYYMTTPAPYFIHGTYYYFGYGCNTVDGEEMALWDCEPCVQTWLDTAIKDDCFPPGLMLVIVPLSIT